MGFPECAAALPECDRYKKKRFCTRFCTFDIIEPSFSDWWRQITDPAIYIGLWDRIISERVLPSVEDSMSAPNPALLRETFPVGPFSAIARSSATRSPKRPSSLTRAATLT